DVAWSYGRNRGLLLAAHDVELADALVLASARVVDCGVGVQLAAEHPQETDLAMLFVQRLEDQRGERLGCGRLEGEALVAQQICRFDGLASRRREAVDDPVE